MAILDYHLKIGPKEMVPTKSISRFADFDEFWCENVFLYKK